MNAGFGKIEHTVVDTRDPRQHEIYNSARECALAAVDKFVAAHGEPMYCGFGNVVIRPARGAFVKYLKDNRIGSKNWNTGWSISSYDIMQGHEMCHTQSMDIKEAACGAFADALNSRGINAVATSRAD